MNRVREIIRADYAVREGIMGENVGVAVLDTGIYGGHPDFDNRIVVFKDFLHDKKIPYDDCGHGTQETYPIFGCHVSKIMLNYIRVDKNKRLPKADICFYPR